ncbi:MAG: L,D-transpeptidase [Synechococcus sp. SP2 MAG]|jgi:lipoprotein-anchoring transpeptidase ErfK/SrfK|nr:L,D-transpeptidase [Synechococcus sp. SP2 MAG]
MRVAQMLMVSSSALMLSGCMQQPNTTKISSQGERPIQIELNQVSPKKSEGTAQNEGNEMVFEVGYGKNGVGCIGSTFEEGVTPLGTFKVNAIMSKDRFEMDETLIKQSGKTNEYLSENLFNNMNSIDFKGDGETGEYGSGYISLTPIPSTPQPFSFNEYDGTYRWYSFAIHGTNDETRIGKRITGGCINMNNKEISKLIKSINLGDKVIVRSNQPCSP